MPPSGVSKEGGSHLSVRWVFSQDSGRAAELAKANELLWDYILIFLKNLRIRGVQKNLEYHIRIVRFLKGNKYAQLLYDLFLRNAFADSCQARYEEFVRLFGKALSHIDGHHHMDLCANLVLSKSIPVDMKMRRNFSFWPGEKGFLNRPCRGLIDRWLARRYRLLDYFFDLTREGKKIGSSRRLGEVKQCRTPVFRLRSFCPLTSDIGLPLRPAAS
jgi:hypothetical protein